MHSVKVCRFSDVAQFLERAEPWLLKSEAENNLILGLARQLIRGDHGYDQPVYLSIIEDDAAVVGCAYRTPPYKLGLTRMPSAVLPLLVRNVAEVYSELPAVMGPESEATLFADLWTRQFGGQYVVAMRQRVHALSGVIQPGNSPPGRLRLAESADVPLATDWIHAFIRDTQTSAAATVSFPRSDATVRAEVIRHIDSGSLYLWEDQQTRSMAAAVGPTPNGIRVGYVYTPPEFRRRGYATALVANLSQLLLDGGRRCCFLYTDLANPTSNAIYARIGYRPVCDVVDVHFT